MLWDAWINEHLWKLHCIWNCTFLLTTCHVEKLTKEIEQWVEILPISPFASPHLQLFLCFHFCLQCFFLLCFQLRLHLCLTKTGPFQVVRITGPSQTFCSGSGVCECVCVCVRQACNEFLGGQNEYEYIGIGLCFCLLFRSFSLLLFQISVNSWLVPDNKGSEASYSNEKFGLELEFPSDCCPNRFKLW